MFVLHYYNYPHDAAKSDDKYIQLDYSGLKLQLKVTENE